MCAGRTLTTGLVTTFYKHLLILLFSVVYIVCYCFHWPILFYYHHMLQIVTFSLSIHLQWLPPLDSLFFFERWPLSLSMGWSLQHPPHHWPGANVHVAPIQPGGSLSLLTPASPSLTWVNPQRTGPGRRLMELTARVCVCACTVYMCLCVCVHERARQRK